MKKFNPLKKKSKVNYPFQKGKKGQDHKRENEKQEEKKTQMGLQSELPYLDQSDKATEDMIKCPECQYPLRVEPSNSSPCPNCGFSGASTTSQNTIAESGKTIKVGSLDLIKRDSTKGLNFKLFDESINSEIKIESKDDELILNREHLDPDNSSISSEEHILLKIKEGSIYISDLSSNGATFIQAKQKTLLSHGTKLVLGNKFFVFNSKSSSSRKVGEQDTKQMGQFDIANGLDQGFELIEEGSGQIYHFEGDYLTLNRANIDPHNTTFSSKEHAIIENESGLWYLRDVSTNGATFKQVTEESRLENKTKIIIGNKVFRFECD